LAPFKFATRSSFPAQWGYYLCLIFGVQHRRAFFWREFQRGVSLQPRVRRIEMLEVPVPQDEDRWRTANGTVVAIGRSRR
jgi:hypothetical protein